LQAGFWLIPNRVDPSASPAFSHTSLPVFFNVFDGRSESVFLSLNAYIRIWYKPSSVSRGYSSLEEALFAVFDRIFLLDNPSGYEQPGKCSTLPKANCSMSSSTKQGHLKVTKEVLA
jgi:hypothetical protein